MTQSFILAIDQGTTGTTALIIDFRDPKNIRVLAKKNFEHPQYFPAAGWVEHDLNQIWESVEKSIQAVTEQAKQVEPVFSVDKIAAIGITNQRETVGAFSRKSGQPLGRAIVWQCRRTTDFCHDLRNQGLEEKIREKTGLVLDPYFSGSKIHWLLNHNKQVQEALKKNDVYFGTIDSYLLFRLSGGQVFATEASNASRTMCFNIKSGHYDDELLKLFSIPSAEFLPEVKDSAGLFAVTRDCSCLPDGIPITGILGDQQAALAGQGCFDFGEAKCTYGTGAFLLYQLGEMCKLSKNGLLTTVAWQLNNHLSYALEGSAFIAGAAIQFLRDQLQFFSHAADSEQLALEGRAAPELYFVPALTGLGAPYWNAQARGAFLGLTRGSSRADMTRAVLEGIAFQVCDLLTAMDQDVEDRATVLRVDGGACANDLLLQIQANLAAVNVERPRNLETTALGAALFAALGVGLYKSLDDLRGIEQIDKSFAPDSDFIAERGRFLRGWKRAVAAVELFSQDHN